MRHSSNISTAIEHNSCLFDIVRYYQNKAVIRIRPINGTFTSGETEEFVTENIDNLTTNLRGGFKEWVKNNY